MLEMISGGFKKAQNLLAGKTVIQEKHIEDAVSQIRVSLLEADVQFQVVKRFIENVKEKAIGELVQTKVSHGGKKLKVSPDQHFIKICHDELVGLMGPVDTSLSFGKREIASIMMVGLQGSGKTTTTAKIAKRLKEKERKKVLMASLDVNRPAAQEQLAVLGSQIDVATLPIVAGQQPVEIASRAMQAAKLQGYDVLMLDTAGRLHVDQQLMDEMQAVSRAANPAETLLVVDSLTGQDAVQVAQRFTDQVPLTGVVLTRMDGDARGGAALSMRAVTGKPIKFAGTGEKLDGLELFQP
ncbi:MAG: Signal recognition particle protein [Deltaproteobacteria bacterium ADurb.Bin510]|nr:MAG: Signal recognition particle protein [Deltaproteobacteria bacterium ADurb.Bin510]